MEDLVLQPNKFMKFSLDDNDIDYVCDVYGILYDPLKNIFYDSNGVIDKSIVEEIVAND